MFCGANLAGAGLKPVIIEAGASAGRKINVSGGGRANFANLSISEHNYVSTSSTDFCKFVLNSFDIHKSLNFFHGRLGLPYEEKEHGRLFLKIPASNLTSRLLTTTLGSGGTIIYNERLQSIQVETDGFKIKTTNQIWRCAKLILALGSSARPALALCSNCWEIARKLGHHVFDAAPALTPLNYPSGKYEKLKQLSGINVEATIRLNDRRTLRDDLLFTHKGLSGPLILTASLFKPQNIIINLLPDFYVERLLDSAENKTPRSVLRHYLPDRLIDAILPEQIANIKIGQLSRQNRKMIAACVNARVFENLLPAGLNKAEICLGGIDLKEIDAESMQSRIFENLYIIGEMQDVAGELGGYNLHWAFASAYCAARHIIKSMAH